MHETFGARLRAAREAAGLSQVQLACGIVNPSHLSLIERDLRRPSPQTVAALALRLGVWPATLVGDDPAVLGRHKVEPIATLGRTRGDLRKAIGIALALRDLGPSS